MRTFWRGGIIKEMLQLVEGEFDLKIETNSIRWLIYLIIYQSFDKKYSLSNKVIKC